MHCHVRVVVVALVPQFYGLCQSNQNGQIKYIARTHSLQIVLSNDVYHCCRPTLVSNNLSFL